MVVDVCAVSTDAARLRNASIVVADIVSVLTACVVLVNLVTGLHGWRSFRRARRELRPRLVSLMVGLVATALAAVVAILTPGLSSAPQSAQAQSTDIVLLPRGAEWSYFFNNYSVPPIPKGPAPFTINACAGDGGTPWWSGGAYIDMYGAEFSAAGVPHNAKVKIRSTGALPISSFPNQVSVSINGYTVGYDQPNGECDAY